MKQFAPRTLTPQETFGVTVMETCILDHINPNTSIRPNPDTIIMELDPGEFVVFMRRRGTLVTAHGAIQVPAKKGTPVLELSDTHQKMLTAYEGNARQMSPMFTATFTEMLAERMRHYQVMSLALITVILGIIFHSQLLSFVGGASAIVLFEHMLISPLHNRTRLFAPLRSCWLGLLTFMGLGAFVGWIWLPALVAMWAMINLYLRLPWQDTRLHDPFAHTPEFAALVS